MVEPKVCHQVWERVLHLANGKTRLENVPGVVNTLLSQAFFIRVAPPPQISMLGVVVCISSDLLQHGPYGDWGEGQIGSTDWCFSMIFGQMLGGAFLMIYGDNFRHGWGQKRFRAVLGYWGNFEGIGLQFWRGAGQRIKQERCGTIGRIFLSGGTFSVSSFVNYS